MKVSEIINTEDISKIVKFFKDNSVEQPKIDELKKQYEVTEHPVFDEAQRPKRKILNDDGQTDRLEDVNRLGLPFQKRIVNSSVSFLFGNPVKIICPASTENEKGAIESIKKILNKNKINSFNRRIARDLFRSTQVAEIWFRTGEQTDPKHRDYGFETPYRIKVVKFSPWDSDELYPYFDQYGDMTAFCRGYSRKVENKTVKYFAVYTDEEYRLYEQADSGWKQADFAVADIKKIPVVFAQEEQPDWADVQSAIERLEYLLSNFADTNDYHGNPKIFIQGNITGFAKKGESGAIIQGDPGAEASYLSWDHAPESIKLEIDNLFKVIYSFTQTPDISFDTLKDLKQGISGVALEMLFMDAHLKVQEKREVFDEYLQRRISVVSAFLGLLNPSFKEVLGSLEIESQITPFMINDIGNVIKNLAEATAGKSILSQKTAISLSGLVANADDELKLIQEEDDRAQMIDSSNPTI